PPQFRVYPSKISGEKIPPSEVGLIIELQRLDRIDLIKFKPTPEFLLGTQTVVEPHSFDLNIKAQWNGNDYSWKFSQIEARAKISAEVIKTLEITTTKAGPAKIKIIQSLTGEVSLNEERVVHIVPRLDGVVTKVFKDLGDRVEKGELLATLESRELADVKIRYLSAVKKSKLGSKDFERETLVYKNTRTMRRLLEQQSDPEEIERHLNSLVIGESRKLLIPAYSKFKLADSVYQREKQLHEKGISSKSEYLLALDDYKSSKAKYLALREEISYNGDWAIQQKQRTAEMNQLNLQTAIQKLQALGLSTTQIELLETQENPIFTQYELRATLSGLVIKRHLTTGEAIKKDDNIFVLADFSDVWVNIAIPVNNIKAVELGQKVRVINESMGIEERGRLTYLSSIIDETNRTVTGRVVIQNQKNLWRPGTFVEVELIVEERPVPISIKAEAIQNLRDWSVVFVKYGDYFEGRPVELGVSDGIWVEVLDGLSVGEEYAVKNSFTVKAEIEKSGATHSH
ncbi:MAG: HlyD family efflux transporter periplasmic adaptor subunit, partial [Nitrospina sp.]|nr:HlyD family efflux transporter periplasmic adaptor subunit [Nitrospina sp.]